MDMGMESVLTASWASGSLKYMAIFLARGAVVELLDDLFLCEDREYGSKRFVRIVLVLQREGESDPMGRAIELSEC